MPINENKTNADAGRDNGTIPSRVKNPDLREKRRGQIIDAAVSLFVEKGYHKTTTREIAAAAGLASGSMYEYVASKEDILYLVCDAIHAEVEQSITEVRERAVEGSSIGVLEGVIGEYFTVCDRMSDHILLIYQESQSLSPQWRKRVLENEIRITGIFTELIGDLIQAGRLQGVDKNTVEITAHNITVLGHMWTFRRWFFGGRYSLKEYTELQTRFIMGIFTDSGTATGSGKPMGVKKEITEKRGE